MHRFRITVEPLSPASEPQTLQFEVENHDDIISIARRMSGRIELDDHGAKAFVIGLKLFSETILQNRTHPLFAPMKPIFGEFMKNLKQHLRANDEAKEGAAQK
jgi:hypothetical protein